MRKYEKYTKPEPPNTKKIPPKKNKKRKRSTKAITNGWRLAIISYLIDRDGNFCAYCGEKSNNYQIDHIVPKTNGGLDRLENFCLACDVCNRIKSNRLPQELANHSIFKYTKND